jgi:hypothetical protein
MSSGGNAKWQQVLAIALHIGEEEKEKQITEQEDPSYFLEKHVW